MKKLILIAGIAIIAILALSINVSLNRDSQTGNIDLAQLKIINEASAECYPPAPPFAGGHCLELIQICLFEVGATECDPYKN